MSPSRRWEGAGAAALTTRTSVHGRVQPLDGVGRRPRHAQVHAFDNAGLRSVANFTVHPDGSAPETSIACDSGPCAAEPYPGQVAVTLAAIDDAAGVDVTRYTLDGTEPTLTNGLTYATPIRLDETTTVTFRSYDKVGSEEAVRAQAIEVEASLPPDPAEVAPPVDPTVPTGFADSTAFLYTGSDPIQTGVAPGAIKPRRVSVLRGKVLQLNGDPLSGVEITILGRPELGRTLSRADGAFDIAANGGATVIVRYEKQDFVSVERSIGADWQEFAHLPDVRMIPYDHAVSPIDLTAGVIQVARGSQVTDDDGTRRATLLFKPGTTATMTLPDGSPKPLTDLRVRATEYTVGENGDEAMPAELPPTSAYTYAVEFSVDEAVDAGATKVTFDQPVASYTENFLGFPVGEIVPVGSFDRASGRWIPEPNGRVVQILSITDGTANLDLDGSGNPATQEAYDALGIGDAERAELASLYSADQTLWRTQVGHFSPWDYNWPYGLPDGARAPNAKVLPSDRGPDGDGGGDTEDDPCKQGGGSTIECQNQTLTEDLLLFGTPFRLHYESDRVPGRKDLNKKALQVLGETVPPQLEAITVNVSVAGKALFMTAPVEPNAAVRFTWDGKDGFGRAIQGEVPFQARIRYQYPAIYKPGSNLAGAASFAQASGSFFGFEPTRLKIFLTTEISGTVGALRATQTGDGLDVGGWTLDVHHVYDARTQTLHRGDGDRVSSRDSVNQIDTSRAGLGSEMQSRWRTRRRAWRCARASPTSPTGKPV